MACIAGIVSIAMAFRATAMVRRRPFSIRIRATIGPASSNSKAPTPAAEPTTDDLKRVVHDGVPGTAMPSFAILPPDEQEALVEYVKYLSIRGMTEKALEDYVGENVNPGDKFDPATNAELRTRSSSNC